ncbi:MAG: SGNH/GDSL hydrolase family protein [Candidatus Eremiobacteraeota bacterium]|nr:SGNH/GDSL hydrolase family protein [Candidatus Eremiobacteraeota bacterium]
MTHIPTSKSKPAPTSWWKKAYFYMFVISCIASVGLFLYAWIVLESPGSEISYNEESGLAVILAVLTLSTIYMMVDYYIFLKVRGWKKALFILASVLIIITGAEISLYVLAAFHPRIHRHSPTLLWELTPELKNARDPAGKYRVSTNSHGFRGKEINMEKPAGQTRIMIIGDSTAFGYPFGDNENFACFLEEKLKKEYPGEDIRVVNAAVSGYSSFQGSQFMKEKGWGFSPDFLVIAFNNDPFVEPVEDRERTAFAGFLPFLKILYRSRLYVFLKEKLTSARINPEDDIHHDPRKGKSRVSPEHFREIYKYFLEEAGKRGVRVIVISLPIKESFHNFPRLRSYREIMKEETGDYGGEFVDLFNKWKNKYSDEIFVDDMHPTIEGHRKIADELFERINNIKHR